ncbi:response regulator [Bifidobacterium leontopitheci]|uniref:DNA-binding response regulator n=1 Tax=Bifidobacterium leontopitheci TaxID=2650774 RepID=A0A6I1GYE8_9BIFI|nr:response regulator [Bifidobacterium leontopitheci]KAB7791481.1 DNA-binding response regulator [Bifidobacterium leontopitheci]
MNDVLLADEYYTGLTVAIVDNAKMSLRLLIGLMREYFPHMGVLWSTMSGSEAVLRFRDGRAIPDLLLLDMSLEGIQGPQVCRYIRQVNDTTRILGITSFKLDIYWTEMQRAGAQGLETKNDDLQLVKAVARIIHGVWMEGFDSPQRAHDNVIRQKDEMALSLREQEVLEYVIAHGSATSKVAQGCGVSQSAVRKMFQSICRKLHVADIGHAMLQWTQAHRL